MRDSQGGGGWRRRLAALGAPLAVAMAAVAMVGGLALTLAGCGRSTSPFGDSGPAENTTVVPDPSAPRVVVLSEAHRSMAQRIGGAAVQVESLSPGAPRTPDLPPSRDAVLAMQSADLVLLNGMGSEPWLEKVSLPEGKVVELSRALKDQPAGLVGIAHRHGPTGVAHRHAATTLPWLDLEAAALQAEEIRTAFTALRPEQAGAFAKRTEALSEELGELDRAFQATAARLQGRSILIVGDDLAAFSHRYGLEATVLGETPDGEPALFLQELDRRRGSGPGAVVLLTQPVSRQLEIPLKARGVLPLVLQDGVGRGAEEDFLAQLRGNLASLRRLLPGKED